MKKGLYISSTAEAAGKTVISAGIGLHLKKIGFNFGYMKPVGYPKSREGVEEDEDATFLQEVFDLKTPKELVTPVLLTQEVKGKIMAGDHADFMPKIQQAYDAVSKDNDIMLLGGSADCINGKFCNVDSLTITSTLGIKTVVIDRIGTGKANIDMLLALKKSFGENMVGVIFNDVPASLVEELQTVITPFLEKRGLPVLGTVPSDPVIKAIRVDELAYSLGGRVATACDYVTRHVEHFLIGSMQVENFMTFFRHEPNTAVLVGGDRADVQLVAIEGECPCIVITGNVFPNDIILSRAETLKVPIILVRSDTYAVAKKIESLLLSNKMRDITKVKRTAQLIEQSVDFERLRKVSGI